MSLSCLEVRALFEGYAAEALPRGERRAVREHLGLCAPCRRDAAASDPVMLFARDETSLVSSEEAARVLEAVRTGIALRTAERRLRPASGRRRAGAIASAAAAVALTLLMPGAPARRASREARRPERAAMRSGFVPAASPAPVGEAFEKTGGTQKYPAGATIYDWNPGSGQTRVVWIVDRSIDI